MVFEACRDTVPGVVAKPAAAFYTCHLECDTDRRQVTRPCVTIDKSQAWTGSVALEPGGGLRAGSRWPLGVPYSAAVATRVCDPGVQLFETGNGRR